MMVMVVNYTIKAAGRSVLELQVFPGALLAMDPKQHRIPHLKNSKQDPQFMETVIFQSQKGSGFSGLVRTQTITLPPCAPCLNGEL